MARKVTVVVSQGQSLNPAKRKLEEDLVAALLMESAVEVTIVPHLYDLAPDGTGMLCLQGIDGDVIVLSWLFPRAARWLMARNGIRGREGVTLLKSPGEDDELDDEDGDGDVAEETDGAIDGSDDDGKTAAVGIPEIPKRAIYCIDLRAHAEPKPYLEEIHRIAAESSVKTVPLMNWIAGSPRPGQVERYLKGNGDGRPATDSAPANNKATHGVLPIISGEPQRVEESTQRRWYPVIDFGRCTNCMECIDFCLFGVYGVDQRDTILVEQPDNCRKGCPACSRVCPENAIIFPQHKTPAIAGANVEGGVSLKIDLSKLFGGDSGDAVTTAVDERDRELVAAGRDAVGFDVGLPKRQEAKVAEAKDELDELIDELDGLDL